MEQLLSRYPLSQTDLDFIRGGPQLIQNLAATSEKNLQDAQYQRQTAATTIDHFREELANSAMVINQFRGELENFQSTGHPSITSTFTNLTSFLKQSSLVNESAINKPPTLPDPSCPSLITCYTNFLKYKEKNGFLTFIEILQKSPSIVIIFREKIRLTEPTFYNFSPHLSDLELFREILSKVFYPYGFTVEAFQLLISANPMTVPITLQTAYSYALFIKDVTEALESNLPQAATLVLKCWEIVRMGIDQRHDLHYKLMSEYPHSYTRFFYSLETKIKSYFESSPALTSATTSHYSANSRNNPLRPNGNYTGGSGSSSPSHSNYTGTNIMSPPPSPPIHQRTVANVSTTPSSCENCGIPGHTSFDCDKDFCRACHQHDQSSLAFFHRPRDCVLFDFHDCEV
jgi:hypothetical protein